MTKVVGFNTAWFPGPEFEIALRDVYAEQELKQLLITHIQARKQCIMSLDMFAKYEVLLGDLTGRMDAQRTTSCFKVFEAIYDLTSPAITLGQRSNVGVQKALDLIDGLSELAERNCWDWSKVSVQIDKARSLLSTDPDDWHARVHLGYAQTYAYQAMTAKLGVFVQRMLVLWVLLNAPVSNQFSA
jgi:hypothetical protein